MSTSDTTPVEAQSFFNQDDATLAAQWGLNTPTPETPAPEPDPAPDEVSAPEVDDGEGAETLDILAPLPDEAPTPEVEPTGEFELKPMDRKPITEFQVLDDQGEVTIPELTIKFKASGKDREYSLDKVVRLAQYGFANAEREEQVQAAKVFVQQVQEEKQEVEQSLQALQQFYDRVLNDPVFYDEAREMYLQRNSPEARAQRLEQELHQERAQQALHREANVVQAFIQKSVVPTTQRLLTEYNTVSDTELIGRWTQLTAPLLVNGRVPVSRLPEVNRLLTEELANWAGALHMERSTERQKQVALKDRNAQEVTRAKRQAARALAPQGRTPGPDGAKPTKFKSADEWLNTAFATNNED